MTRSVPEGYIHCSNDPLLGGDPSLPNPEVATSCYQSMWQAKRGQEQISELSYLERRAPPLGAPAALQGQLRLSRKMANSPTITKVRPAMECRDIGLPNMNQSMAVVTPGTR